MIRDCYLGFCGYANLNSNFYSQYNFKYEFPIIQEKNLQN